LTHDINEVLRKLRESQALEIPVWLHLLGKFTSNFYTDPKADKKVPQEIESKPWIGFDWSDSFSQIAREDYTIKKAIEKHQDKTGGFGSILDFLKDSHGRSSGTDKGWMVQGGGKFNKSGTQTNGQVFRATPFGYESEIDTKAIEDERKKFYQKIAKSLKKKCQDISISELDELCGRYFKIALSETRRPMNDVMLDDATETAVAFFRSAMAAYPLPKSQEKPIWKVARFNLDVLDYISSALEIPDLKGRETRIKTVLDSVRSIIEHQNPLGHEIFRDEKGALYIVPDLWDDKFRKTIEEKINERLDSEFKHKFSISLESTRSSSRSLIGSQVLASKESTPLSPQLESIESIWKEIRRPSSLCMLCGWNPVEDDKERTQCTVCSEFRESRASDWLKDLDSTIWMDEVSDKNGQIALICGWFEVEHWIDGKFIRTLMNWDTSNFNIVSFKEALREWSEKSNSSKIKTYISKNIIDKFKSFDYALKFYTDEGEVQTDKVSTMAWLLLSQQDSPARIFRTWKTTKVFWEECVSLIHNMSKQATRYEITLTNTLDLTEGVYEIRIKDLDFKLPTYWDKEKSRFIIIINPELVNNLLRTSKAQDFTTMLGDYQVEVLESGGYQEQEVVVRYSSIDTMTPVDCEFSRDVEVITTPRVFMILVPGSKAMEYLAKMKEKYENEMGFVRNRLPIHLGIIFGDRRTPLRIFLDAGRRMLKQKSGRPIWEVRSIECNHRLPSHLQGNPQFAESRKITLRQDKREIDWIVPLKMGDGQTSDQWYGYCIVDEFINAAQSRNMCLEIPDPDNEGKMVFLCHVSQLEVGDKIRFTESTFDFEYLGESSARFEICYDEHGFRMGMRRRPYLLEELDTIEYLCNSLDKHLTRSQINQIIEMIEMKRTEWGIVDEPDPLFRNFCGDVLKSANWHKNNDAYPWSGQDKDEWFDRLADHAARGVLTDADNLYLRIIRPKSQKEE
jgi:hypothetical protein